MKFKQLPHVFLLSSGFSSSSSGANEAAAMTASIHAIDFLHALHSSRHSFQPIVLFLKPSKSLINYRIESI